MKIALLQTLVHADHDLNLRTASSLIARAKSEGADLAVLPEMFCCPYDTALFPAYAEPDEGDRWHTLSQISRTHGIFLVAGSVPELSGEQIYNTSYVFAPDGTQIAKHRKVHLFDINLPEQYFLESDTLSFGSGITTFDTPFCHCGLSICYDIRFPEYFARIAAAGAQVVFVPASFNPKTGPAHWELLFRARAMDNQLFTVGVASACNPNSSYRSYGHSIAVSPWGDVITQMNDQPGFEMVTLDLQLLHSVRAQMPFAEHRAARIAREHS